MARKRKIFDNNLSRENKKPSPDSKNENVSAKVNLLNDKLLSLYKKDVTAKVESPVVVLNDVKRNVDESNCNSSAEEQNKNSEDVERGKTPGKTPKKIYQVKRNTVLTLKHSFLTFDDVGGMDKSLMEVLQLFIHLKYPQLFEAMGVRPVRGFLLHGPPGCGKTHLARATAGELSLPYIEVAATELVCGISGESESKIRDMFDEAIKSAPCILFIDEIDAVSPKRDTADKGMEKRMVAQLLKCLDELNEKDVASHVMVIGATNRPDSIDPALRRGGRFDREIAIGMPDEKARFNILEVLCKNLKLSPDFDLHWLAHLTPGYVGADLKSLITESVKIGIWRICKSLISSIVQEPKVDCDGESGEVLPNIDVDLQAELPLQAVRQWFKTKSSSFDEQAENLYFEPSDFKSALQNCVPYSKREGFATVPNVTWDDVGGLADIQKKLITSILWPVKYPKIYEKNNITSSKGILLYGPKGCGKTLLAKAIANECSINFLSVKGPELLSMYLGESEKAVRQCFQRARNSAPCVIFFDELDALCPTRSGSNVNAAAERVVNQLLTEMDGMEPRHQVFVIGATNRMEKIDSAMLRPGRLEKRIFVDIPSPAGRVEILKSITKNKTAPKMSDDIELEKIGLDSRCTGFSGADLAYLVREAFFKAMDDQISSTSFVPDIEIKMEHFEYAFGVVKPSIDEKDLKYFRNHPVHSLGT